MDNKENSEFANTRAFIIKGRTMDMKINKSSQLIQWAIGVVAFLFFLIGNIYSPYMADDYGLALVRGESLSTAIREGLVLGKNYYFNHFGSFVSSVFLPMLMNYPKTVFNLINSGYSVILIFLLYYQLGQGKKEFIGFGLSCFFFLLCLPVPAQDLFWVTGSIVYLWSLVWCIGFITFYSNYDASKVTTKIRYIILPLLGLVAGNSHGAMGGICFFASLLYMAYWYYILKIEIPGWAIIGALSSLVGVVIMVAAPGNWCRLDGRSDLSFLKMLFYQATNLATAYSIMGLLLIVCLLLFWIHIQNKKNDKFIKMNINALLGFLGVGALLIVPAGLRASLFFPFFAAVSLGFGIQLIPKGIIVEHIKIGLLFILAFSVGIKYFNLYNDGRRIRAMVEIRENTIKQLACKGKNPIYVFDMSTWPIYQRYTGYGLTDVTEDAMAWQNTGMAKYYHVTNIVGVSYGEYFRERNKRK